MAHPLDFQHMILDIFGSPLSFINLTYDKKFYTGIMECTSLWNQDLNLF